MQTMQTQYDINDKIVDTDKTNSINNVSNKKSIKQYTQDFKAQVIAVYKSGIYDSAIACAKAYGISDKTLYGWLKQHSRNTTPSATLEQQAEMAKLKKELARAKMENDILKKAAIYFANQAR